MERWYRSTDSLANLYLFRAHVFVISAVVVQCSLLCFSLVVACDGRERAFSWGHRLGNNFIPDSWYDFGKLQCYCMPQFLHQRTSSELHFVFEKQECCRWEVVWCLNSNDFDWSIAPALDCSCFPPQQDYSIHVIADWVCNRDNNIY